MKAVGMFLAMTYTVLFTLTMSAQAGSGDAFSPLETIELYGSACRAGSHTVGGAAVAFVCEFDHTLSAGLAGIPEFPEEALASVTLLEKNVAGGTPLKRRALQVRVAGVRLEDGTECLNAGTGATIAVSGKRVNFTCDADRTALVGSFERLENMLLAERVVFSEAGEPLASVIVPVTTLTLDAETPLP